MNKLISYSPGLHARTLDVAKATKINKQLSKLIERAVKRKDCPLWLITGLNDCLSNSNHVIGALERYRTERETF